MWCPHSCQLVSMLHSCHDPEVWHAGASNVWGSFTAVMLFIWESQSTTQSWKWQVNKGTVIQIIDVFFVVGLNKLLNKRLSFTQWNFLHRGFFVREIKPIPTSCSGYHFRELEILLNKQPSCSRFPMNAVFWRRYQIMTSEQGNSDTEHWCFLCCWPAQTLKQTV